jgi:cysteine-rich repeat protein
VGACLTSDGVTIAISVTIARIAVVACWLAGCIESALVPCGELACPAGQVCTPGGCASPADVTACEGMAEGAACRASTGGIGTCEGGACRIGLCGNGVVDVGEVCDDGNQVSGDGCRGDCKKMEVCGDGELDVGEQCDDGNHNPADGCDNCKLTSWQISLAVGSAIPATSATLADPGAIAVDPSGRIFIADTDNNRVLRVELDGSLTTIAGTGTTGFAGDGGPATSAQLAQPAGVAVDGLGRVFISDGGNARIRVIAIDGTITTLAGTGTPGFGGDGGPAILAQLANPRGVAVDGLGTVFVADTDNNRIRRIGTDGTIATIVGDGNANYFGDGGDASLAEVWGPWGVAIDPIGRLVVADTFDQRVRRIELDNRIFTIAGDGTANYFGDGGPATAAELQFPVGLAFDAQGRLYIADVVNERIRRIEIDGTIATIAGTGDTGFSGDGGAATAAVLANPFGVAIDAQGRIAIADTSNQRVRRVDAAGTISTVAGTGAFGFGGDGNAATSAALAGPFGVAVDTTGRIYIADTFNARIRRIELDGTITTIAGTGQYGFSGDGGPATRAQLAKPDGVAVDASGQVYIADTYNHRIRKVALDGTITTIAGDGNNAYGGDGGPATSASLQNPNGVAIDGSGQVFIADTYNYRIRKIALDGTITTVAGSGPPAAFGGDGGPATSASLSFPYYLAFDHEGRLVFSDTGNNRIRRVDLDGTIHTLVGTGPSGGPGGYNGDGIPATTAMLAGPYGVAVDAQDRVVIGDDVNQRIRRIELDGTISTVAGTGVEGADGDAAAATSAQMFALIGVAVDGQGRVLVADQNNNRIRAIDPTTHVIHTIAGKIDPENAGPAATARLVDPQAIAFSPALTVMASGTSGTLEAIRNGRVIAIAGRYPQADATGALARYRTNAFGTVGGVAIDPATGIIYLSETSANRLHVIMPVDPNNLDTWTITTLANSSGTAGFADGDALSAQFRAPTGLYLDTATSTLYIADTGNHAIRALDLVSRTISTVANASHGLGFGGDGGPATAALLFEPTAITRCGNGDLFIADTGNNRVRRISITNTISTVLGDGVPASSGEGAPARTFPVDRPRGLACDSFGNLFVTSRTAVRLLAASDQGYVDGLGAVMTIYGAPPRVTFPSTVTNCLSGLAVTGATSLRFADACTGLVVELDRM